ncbi:MAG: SRPBCC family protein [Candidatus Kapabacteria bacterium]|nr:SRPBCC family protein [Candidatus Kapabacteria bacterium]
MNVIKKILLVFFSSLALIFIISVFLPAEYEIVRTKEFDCSSEKIYEYLIDINHLDEWFYITKSLDSSITYKFNIDTLNSKSSVEWNGELMGQGTFEYTKLKMNEKVEFRLSFQNNSVFKSGKIVLYPTDKGTKIKWTDYGENGWNPVNRIFGLFIDSFLGPDMEKSLKKLKDNLDC